MDDCPDRWCKEGGCDWGCGDEEPLGSDNHGDYCCLCYDRPWNCEEYCYDMDDCPDLWCEEGGCDEC